ncbi:MAG: diphosphomevalonate decarboxylase [Gilvibacter sp.]
MIHDQFKAQLTIDQIDKGAIAAQAPSNIALVKYWGKYGQQLPKNTSISFTLSNCKTTTTLEFERKNSPGFDFEVYLDEQREIAFEPKIEAFFERILPYCPYLEEYSFKINTHNSFPHSSGIASSASGMSALATCLVQLEQKISTIDLTPEDAIQKASFLSRLGSGSACRSLEGPIVVWGEHDAVNESSNLFGTLLRKDIHPIFKDYCDTILLVDKGQKQVSSTVGHGLMHGHPFAQVRFDQANENIGKILKVLSEGDQAKFIEIVESEALSLHAMMMTSLPYFILFKPNTLKIIETIWHYRKDTGIPVCFTLDAGANVHVLYASSDAEAVQNFISKELSQYCQNRQFIHDKAGMGASLI